MLPLLSFFKDNLFHKSHLISDWNSSRTGNLMQWTITNINWKATAAFVSRIDRINQQTKFIGRVSSSSALMSRRPILLRCFISSRPPSKWGMSAPCDTWWDLKIGLPPICLGWTIWLTLMMEVNRGSVEKYLSIRAFYRRLTHVYFFIELMRRGVASWWLHHESNIMDQLKP